jgi:hypothetical protein
MGRLTDVGPAGLVPAAWLVTILAHVDGVSDRTLLIALGVMTVLLAAFYVAARGQMSGVLAVWHRVILVGFFVTLPGTVALAVAPDQTGALAVTLYGWMLLPAVAYVPTGQAHADPLGRRVYLWSAVLSVAGTAVYAAGHLLGAGPDWTLVAGLALVGVGQTAGIVAAALQNTGRIDLR